MSERKSVEVRNLEEAILQAKHAGGKATVIAIGPEIHNDALKHSLAMRLDEAVRIAPPALGCSPAPAIYCA